MAVLVVYPNKLDTTKRHFTPVLAGQTLDEWMIKNVNGYHFLDLPPLSYFVNNEQKSVDDWLHYCWKENDLIELYAEPQDPATIVIGIIAVVAAGVAIYAMSQIPDNFQRTTPEGSPIYSANAQGNQPRLMGIVPELFGRHKTYPDIISEPHWYFSGDDEFLLMLMTVGVGEYEFTADDIYIADTPISSYGADISFQKFNPDEVVTTHPAHENIYTSREVGATSSTSGIELEGAVNSIVPTITKTKQNTLSVLTKIDNFLTEYWVAEWEIGHVIVIANASSDSGRYLIKSIESPRATVAKLASGLTEIPDWSSFTAQGDQTGWRITAERTLAGKPAGPFFACPAAEVTDQISIDIKFPDGIGRMNDEGNIESRELRLMIEWRGEGEETWNQQQFKRGGATRNQLGNTIKINVGRKVRPEVRLYRITGDSNDSRVFDRIEFKRLKSRLEANTRYPDFTVLAVSIRGSNSLSRSAENKLGVIATRKLQVPENGGWTPERYVTRDIAPVVRYIILDSGLSDLQISDYELLRLHNIWQARNDVFDAVFTDQTTLFEVLKKILAIGYAEPTLNHGQIVPVRDELRNIFDAQFQPDNMLGKGLERSSKFVDESEPDGVEVEYFSTETWKPETISCLLDGDLGLDAEKVRAFGITSRKKAWQFGMRVRRKKRYRRISYSFQTEMDGFNSNYLDYIALADDVPGYTQSGRVENCTVANGKTYVTLDIDVKWGDGTHHIAFRKPNGKLSGPYVCTPDVNSFVVVIVGNLDFYPVFDGSIEPTLWIFGESERWCYPALVDDVTPNGTDKCTVKAVNYDSRVYLDDDNEPPD